MELEDLDEELEEKVQKKKGQKRTEKKVGIAVEEDDEGEAVSWSAMETWRKVVIIGILFVISVVLGVVLWAVTPKKDAGGQAMGNIAEESGQEVPLDFGQLPTVEPTEAPVVATPAPTTVPTPEPTVAPTGAPTVVPTPEADSLGFVHTEDSVTPKDVINLRSNPSTADDSNIVTQAMNGQTLSRIGINSDTGWSKIDYQGQILYAVSQYLTTDLSYKTPVEATNPNRVSTKDGRIIVFVDCDDWITPKEYVNLRTEPSTTEGNTTVSCQLLYGEIVHRTGYSANSGWSRVEYNGQVLYVVSSYMKQVQSE